MAAFFWIHTGANAQWNTSGNWSGTTGGSSNASTPSITSDVTFDGAGTHGNEASTITASQSVLSLTFTSGYTALVTINALLTIAGNFTDNTAHTWAGSNAMTISAASTITSGGKIFPLNVNFTGSNTKTLVGDWTIQGVLTCSTATTTINKTASETLTCSGGITFTGATAGNINLTISGGTWQGTANNTMTGTITLTGTFTVSGAVHINGCTLVNSSASATTTSSTLTVDGASTLNTNGISWNNITFSASLTVTISSLLTATGTMTISNGIALIFSGTAGWTVGTLTANHLSAATTTLVHNLTYTITTAFNCFASRTGSIALFTSDDGTTKAILTLNNGATCNVLAAFTRIDASGGRPILSFNGTITTCFNIVAQTDVQIPPPKDSRKLGRRNPIYNRSKTVVYQIP